jgi:conjugal transfer pilus assembly protein TrbC
MPDVGNYYTGKLRNDSASRIDAAMQAAKGGAIGRIPNIITPTVGIDVDQIASRYKEMGKVIHKPDESLLVFISTSMSVNTLVKLGNQAKRANAVLVLRGVPGGIASGWARALAQLKPIVATGASVQINPDLFRLYAVDQVPTFVISRLDKNRCVSDNTDCQALLHATGDVSLDYVLEKWAEGSGDLAKVAQAHLDQMGGIQR